MVQQQKLQELMTVYDDLYSLDLFGETIEGNKNINPYDYQEVKTFYNTHVEEDRKALSKVSTIEGFENIDDIDK